MLTYYDDLVAGTRTWFDDEKILREMIDEAYEDDSDARIYAVLRYYEPKPVFSHLPFISLHNSCSDLRMQTLIENYSATKEAFDKYVARVESSRKEVN